MTSNSIFALKIPIQIQKKDNSQHRHFRKQSTTKNYLNVSKKTEKVKQFLYANKQLNIQT